MRRHDLATLTAVLLVTACSSNGGGDDTTGSGGADAGSTGMGPTTGATGPANASSTGTGGSAPQGKPFYVIGGQDERRIVSEDGVTWTEDTYVAPNNGLDNAYSGAAIGNGAVVLSGDPGVLRSTDGHTWNKVTLPVSANLHSSKVAVGNGVFVLVAHADAFRSADGLTWEHAADTGDSGHWGKVAFGGGHWVAIGDGHTKVSEDGLAWHDYNATPAAEPIDDLAYGNGVFVGVGKTNNMARVTTSPDGVNWTEQTPVPTSYDTGFGGVAFGNGTFVASDCCNAFESTDGVTWTKRGKGFQGAIVFVGGTFVAAGWRTEAAIYHADTGDFEGTLHGDQPNVFDAAELAPWFTAIGAGTL